MSYPFTSVFATTSKMCVRAVRTLSRTPVTWTHLSEDWGAQLENTFTMAPLLSLISLIFCPLLPMTPPTIDWWMSSLSSLSPSSSCPLVASYM